MRGFDKEEFLTRVKKAQQLMEANNIEIIIITSPHNFRYFTGLDSYFWESPARPWFLLLSLNEDPIAIIPSIGKTALENTWIKNIVTWQSPNPEDEGISTLKETILSMKSKKFSSYWWSRRRIGFELGKESQLRMPIKDFYKLKESLSNFKFINASNIIWKLRIIKSKNEISKLKKIISIASKAFDGLPNQIKINNTEIEICNLMKRRMLDLGADHTLYMSCASGKGGYNQIICDPKEKKLTNGDILTIDTGTTYDGYFCDFNRNFGFGIIDNSANTAYEILWEATEIGMQKAKPGNTCADIYKAITDILDKENPILNSVGRMGHGVGLQLTEPPSIMSNDNTLLKENMIIAIEPCLEYAPGTMIVHEENILITENGYERLSTRTPKSIPIIK